MGLPLSYRNQDPPVFQQYLRSKTVNQRSIMVEEIGDFCELGDWKLLSLLAENMEPLVFGAFIQQLSDRVQARQGSSRRYLSVEDKSY